VHLQLNKFETIGDITDESRNIIRMIEAEKLVNTIIGEQDFRVYLVDDMKQMVKKVLRQ
jgi:hypothetical protein